MIYGQVLATISLAIVSCLSGQALAAPTQDTFESAGLVLHYQISGQGSPVVILAGGPGFGASYMQPVVAIVARNHTAILLEQRGTGRSVPAVETPDKTWRCPIWKVCGTRLAMRAGPCSGIRSERSPR